MNRSESAKQMGLGSSKAGVRRYRLETEHPIAADSIDHLYPLGTKHDNYRSSAFTRKLVELYRDGPLAVLDLGCAGGGFVKEVVEYGREAVGLEGSDYSWRHHRAEWATIPDRLFTCDCTQPFTVLVGEAGETKPAVFDVVTAWEFLEHIPEARLPVLFDNIRRHLSATDGLFIASISLCSSMEEGREYHATIRPEWWWRSQFLDHGFCLVDQALDYFDENWVRGPTPEQGALASCHVVLSLAPNNRAVRLVDRAVLESPERVRVWRSVLKRQMREAQDHAEELKRLLERLQDAIVAGTAGNNSFTMLELQRLAAHAIDRCRLQGIRRVAFHGAGGHTRYLLPLWRAMCGPEVAVILANEATGETIGDVPVQQFGAQLAPDVDAIVPSSHAFEKEMFEACRRAYPTARWIFLWNPVVAAPERSAT